MDNMCMGGGGGGFLLDGNNWANNGELFKLLDELGARDGSWFTRNR